LIVQINPFRPSPSHYATDSQSFQFNIKIFSLSAFAWGPQKIFHDGLNPFLTALLMVFKKGVKLGKKKRKKKKKEEKR
jgi:hypothetical protein